jgi:hypothetical protein
VKEKRLMSAFQEKHNFIGGRTPTIGSGTVGLTSFRVNPDPGGMNAALSVPLFLNAIGTPFID